VSKTFTEARFGPVPHICSEPTTEKTMQYVELTLSGRTFHCPVSGLAILATDDLNPDAPSVVALWLGFADHEPVIHHADLKEAWEGWAEQAVDLEAGMPKFLQAFTGGANWVAYRLIEPSTGPFSMGSVWLVVDHDARAGS
jgi:hypothetical protein